MSIKIEINTFVRNTPNLLLAGITVALALVSSAANADTIGVAERYTTQHLSFTNSADFSDAWLIASGLGLLAVNARRQTQY
jgi:hypothetical protein